MTENSIPRLKRSPGDQERDAYLKGHNYIVLRFRNEQVLSDVEAVLHRICDVALTAPSPWQRSKSTT